MSKGIFGRRLSQGSQILRFLLNLAELMRVSNVFNANAAMVNHGEPTMALFNKDNSAMVNGISEKEINYEIILLLS